MSNVKITKCYFYEAKSAECEKNEPKTCEGDDFRHTNGRGKQTPSRTIFAKAKKQGLSHLARPKKSKNIEKASFKA